MKREQQRLYALLSSQARCFVHICQTDDALWVSDLPLRCAAWEQMSQRLAMEGFCCWHNELTGLLCIDLSKEAWREYLRLLPETFPPMPVKETYHPLYALCRLWMLHPSVLTSETCYTLRRVIKLTQADESLLLREVPALLAGTAERLRKEMPVAYDAGRVLADWLTSRKGIEE